MQLFGQKEVIKCKYVCIYIYIITVTISVYVVIYAYIYMHIHQRIGSFLAHEVQPKLVGDHSNEDKVHLSMYFNNQRCPHQKNRVSSPTESGCSYPQEPKSTSQPFPQTMAQANPHHTRPRSRDATAEHRQDRKGQHATWFISTYHLFSLSGLSMLTACGFSRFGWIAKTCTNTKGIWLL